MGYDLCRFEGTVDGDLRCPICSGVLEDPVQAEQCEHAFCRGCIHQWLLRKSTCPVDRCDLTSHNLKAAPRILRNMLSRLMIKCDHADYGCTRVMRLDALSRHLAECEFNPHRPVLCKNGCGCMIHKSDLKNHKCLEELRALIDYQQQTISELRCSIAAQNAALTELEAQLKIHFAFSHAMCFTNPLLRALASKLEHDQIVRWCNQLPRAHVTRWGSMISTPDEPMQNMLRDSLEKSGCPMELLEGLMPHCHERLWPDGMNSLELRRDNRRIFEKFFCRLIPGKQAVVIMLTENLHMPIDFMTAPGMVVLFAVGVKTCPQTCPNQSSM